ncbi:MAG: hypothetical protein ABIG20_04350 [archaeon]
MKENPPLEKHDLKDAPRDNGGWPQVRLPLTFLFENTHLCEIRKSVYDELIGHWKSNEEREGMLYGRFRQDGKKKVWTIEGICGFDSNKVKRLFLASGEQNVPGKLSSGKERVGDVNMIMKDLIQSGFSLEEYAKVWRAKNRYYWTRLKEQVIEGRKKKNTFLWKKGEKLRKNGMQFFGSFHTHTHIPLQPRHLIPPIELVSLLVGKGRPTGLEGPINIADYYCWGAQLIYMQMFREQLDFNTGNYLTAIFRDQPHGNKMWVMPFALHRYRSWRGGHKYRLGLVTNTHIIKDT